MIILWQLKSASISSIVRSFVTTATPGIFSSMTDKPFDHLFGITPVLVIDHLFGVAPVLVMRAKCLACASERTSELAAAA